MSTIQQYTRSGAAAEPVTVADEILTGCARTGEFPASTAFGIEPDIILMSKGLANGLPLSLLIMKKELTENEFALTERQRDPFQRLHPGVRNNIVFFYISELQHRVFPSLLFVSLYCPGAFPFNGIMLTISPAAASSHIASHILRSRFAEHMFLLVPVHSSCSVFANRSFSSALCSSTSSIPSSVRTPRFRSFGSNPASSASKSSFQLGLP